MELIGQKFVGVGDVIRTKKFSSKDLHKLLMQVSFESDQGKFVTIDCEIHSLVYPKSGKPRFNDIYFNLVESGELHEGLCVKVEGFFRTRSYIEQRFKNQDGKPFKVEYPVLVVEKLVVLD